MRHKFKTNWPQDLLFRALPQLFLELMSRYFRVEVEGLENIPKRGPIIFAPNHSGVSGLDAMILAHQIRKVSGRQVRVLTHNFWFRSKATARPAQKLGFIEANLSNGLKILNKNQPIIIFPEGEHGNFKPSLQAYDLREFKRGFVRMAIKARAPIVPTLVIGAEETHINLSQFKFPEKFRGLILPIPLNFIPLPTKWRIQFLPAIMLPYGEESCDNNELVHELAEDIRENMQMGLNGLLAKRKSVFF